ncbi:MAG: hypothetical protein PHO44_01750, partial [Sphaerochaetaceae bacterium]|nr:hypothetical protein [Sphaerochaetaceae bacterium]
AIFGVTGQRDNQLRYSLSFRIVILSFFSKYCQQDIPILQKRFLSLSRQEVQIKGGRYFLPPGSSSYFSFD